MAVTYAVAASATLGGFTTETFNAAARQSFTAALASSLGVQLSAVNITGVTNAGARRRLHQGGVQVQFTVVAASSASATALQTGVTAMQADPTVFTATLNTELASAGVAVQCTVQVSAPVVVAQAAAAATVNVTEIVNITSAQTQLTAQLTSANSAALSVLQTSFLGALGTAGSNLTSAADVGNMAALVQSVVAASNGTALAPAVQTAALAALASLSSSSAAVNSDTGASMLATMTAVFGGSSGGGGGAPAAQLSADALGNAAQVMLTVASSVPLSAATTDAVLNVLGRTTAAAPSATNISSATSAVLLRTMSVVTNATAAPLSTASTDSAAAVMLAVTRSVDLTPAATTTVLSVLSVVASGSVNASGGAGGNIVNALSSVASSSSANSTAGGATLRSVSGVLDTLAVSQVASLLTALNTTSAPPPPAVSVSPTIQTLIQVDPPGAARLTAAPLLVSGSASAFQAMPAAVFAGITSGVVTEFRSTTFDPYDSSGDTSGVTRLAFNSSGGGAIAVAGLSTPIYFNLSAVATAPGQKAQCQWWDTSASSYSTAGCAGLPNPQPSADALRVFWIPGFSTLTDAGMASAWNASGPLLANCTRTVLDCSDVNNTQVVFPNPAQPFLYKPIKCDATISTAQMVVFAGSLCALISQQQPCYWDNIMQSFQGAGCVAAPAQQCACRHVRATAPAMPCWLHADANARFLPRS